MTVPFPGRTQQLNTPQGTLPFWSDEEEINRELQAFTETEIEEVGL